MKAASRLLMCISCSANLLVYCAASAAFRRVLVSHFKRLIRFGRGGSGDDLDASMKDSHAGSSQRRMHNVVVNKNGEADKEESPLRRLDTKTSLLLHSNGNHHGGGVHNAVVVVANGGDPDAIVQSDLL